MTARLLHKRQNTNSLDLPFSGSVVVSNPTPTASVLAHDTAAVGSSSPQTGVPLVSTASSSAAFSTSTSDASSSSTPSSTSNNQIPLGTVIGACLAAFVALLLAIFLALYCSRRQKRDQKRRIASRACNAAKSLRRLSHPNAWGRLHDDEEDRWDGKSSPLKTRPNSGPIEWLAAMFSRAPSTPSVEKSAEGPTPPMRESFGTLEPFEKYHPHLAAQMALEAGAQVTVPPPARPFMGRTDVGPSVSWDGETLGAESFVTSRSLLQSGAMSPTWMSNEKLTPPATASDPHRWHKAEVLHTDHTAAVADRDPFADITSAPLRRTASNPFFNAQEKQRKRPPPLPTTSTNPFADSCSVIASDADSTVDLVPQRNPAAIVSLIEALETGPDQTEEPLRIPSMHSSIYSSSSYLASELGDDASTVAAFPYPPVHHPHP